MEAHLWSLLYALGLSKAKSVQLSTQSVRIFIRIADSHSNVPEVQSLLRLLDHDD
jgi:hypothetical protein